MLLGLVLHDYREGVKRHKRAKGIYERRCPELHEPRVISCFLRGFLVPVLLQGVQSDEETCVAQLPLLSRLGVHSCLTHCALVRTLLLGNGEGGGVSRKPLGQDHSGPRLAWRPNAKSHQSNCSPKPRASYHAPSIGPSKTCLAPGSDVPRFRRAQTPPTEAWSFGSVAWAWNATRESVAMLYVCHVVSPAWLRNDYMSRWVGESVVTAHKGVMDPTPLTLFHNFVGQVCQKYSLLPQHVWRQ